LERVAGVKVGDMVKYGNYRSLFSSNSPGAVAPQSLIDTNNTLSVTNTVLSVSGSAVSYESRSVYRNGTERVSVREVDVASGMGLSNFYTFVGAGLGVGDKVYVSAEFSNMTLNSTSLRGYCGLMRETNLLNITQIVLESARASTALWIELYWDKATGLLTEQSWETSVYDEDGFWSGALIKYEMVDNNVWVGVSDSVLPIAKAGSDQTVDVGATVAFDAGESRDNVGIARFLWDFGDGESAEGLQVSHAYDKVGVFNLTLTVEDGAGNKGFDYVSVTVKKAAVASFQLPLLVAGFALVVCVAVWLVYRRRHRRGRRRR